jgi:hypothetical protein
MATNVYIVGNDKDFTVQLATEFEPYLDLPLEVEVAKLNVYAMSDKFEKLNRHRALLLFQIVVEAFSNFNTINQIFSGAGFNDKLSAPEHLRELIAQPLMRVSAEKRANSSTLSQVKHNRKFDMDLIEAYEQNDVWVVSHVIKLSPRRWQVSITETGIEVQLIFLSGQSRKEDKFFFAIRIQKTILKNAIAESSDHMDHVDYDPSTPLSRNIVTLELWNVNNACHETSDFELPCAFSEVTVADYRERYPYKFSPACVYSFFEIAWKRRAALKNRYRSS